MILALALYPCSERVSESAAVPLAPLSSISERQENDDDIVLLPSASSTVKRVDHGGNELTKRRESECNILHIINTLEAVGPSQMTLQSKANILVEPAPEQGGRP